MFTLISPVPYRDSFLHLDKLMKATQTDSIDIRSIQHINGGFIANIYKPVDWSSFDVVKKIRGITRIKKIGHAGTLDPFAEGVLLICAGKATKEVSRLMELPKEYNATMVLGISTDTLDKTGKVDLEKNIPPLSPKQIDDALVHFLGKIKQKIPDYSAAKIKGQRRYKLARKGKEIPVSYKSVQIYNLQRDSFQSNILQFRVKCSRGTYVRVLAYDIAKKLGTVGYLSDLTRTSIGDFAISESLTISEFEKQWKQTHRNEDISHS